MSPGTITGCPGKARVAPLRCTSSRRADAVDLVLLFLGDVVRDVVHARQAEIARPDAEHTLERLARRMREHLAVGASEVGGGPHGREIVDRLAGLDRRTRELAIAAR